MDATQKGWMPPKKMDATQKDGCHPKRWMPPKKMDATQKDGWHPFACKRVRTTYNLSMEIDLPQRKRCKRYNIPGHAHELTFSCYHGQPFLKSPVACDYLAQAIESNRSRHSFKLWAYVFMPEHVHLLIYPTEDNYSISKILQAIKLSVSKKMIHYLKSQKKEALKCLQTSRRDKNYMFWQDGGGYDRNIFQKNICRDVIYYIHANPVRRGLVDKASQWYYSSYNDWEGFGQGPVNLDMENFRKF